MCTVFRKIIKKLSYHVLDDYVQLNALSCLDARVDTEKFNLDKLWLFFSAETMPTLISKNNYDVQTLGV